MSRLRFAAAAAGALLFTALFAAACCSTPATPIPDGTTFTAASPTGRMIVYGDSRPAQTGESFFLGRYDAAEERRRIIERLAEEKPDVILHSGDLVAISESADLWEEWDRNHRILRDARIPFFPTPGNHEYRGLNERRALANYHRRFPELGGRHWYAVRYGPILFALLDSNFDELTEEDIARQDVWLDRTLTAADADEAIRSVVLVCHHPPFTNSKVHGPSEEVVRRFVGRAKASPKFRALIAGHVHNYERFLVDGVHYVVSGGGGAPPTPVRTQKYRTPPAFEGPELRPFHYLVVSPGPNRTDVEVMMLQPDGSWKAGDRFAFGP